MSVDLSSAGWRKSTWSGHDGCVEVALVEGQVAVRNSKDRGGPVLWFTTQEWTVFLSSARADRSDVRQEQALAESGPS